MRPIKFRGLGYDGKWHYGYFVKFPSDGDTGSFIFDGKEWEEVKGKTVGQFTGLLDKNGKEIFEDDRVLGAWESVVVFDGSRFKLKDVEDDLADLCSSVEVVRTIYENPELIEK